MTFTGRPSRSRATGVAHCSSEKFSTYAARFAAPSSIRLASCSARVLIQFSVPVQFLEAFCATSTWRMQYADSRMLIRLQQAPPDLFLYALTGICLYRYIRVMES